MARGPNQELQEVEQTTFQMTAHEGPFPAPDVLADYERLHPGTAAVIIEMGRREQEHRHLQERERLQSEIRHRDQVVALRASNARGTFTSDLLGQALGFAIAGGCVAGAVFSVLHGADWPVVTAFLSLPVVGIIKAIRSASETKAQDEAKK